MPMVAPPRSFHLLGFSKADTAGATLENITAVANDNFATLSPSGNYFLQDDYRLMAAYGRNAGLTQMQISTPDFRRVSVPFVYPLNVAAAPVALSPYAWYRDAGIIVPRLDELAVLASNGGAGGVDNYSGLWIQDRSHTLNVPPGQCYTLLATSTITRTARQWTQGTLAFNQVLPSGTYAVVGMGLYGATTEFGRLAFLGGGMRPGVICQPTLAAQPWRDFLKGNCGVWGSFTNTAPPNIEVLGTAGGAVTYNVILDVVMTGPG